MMRMPVFENPTAFLFLAAIPALFILRQLKIFKKVFERENDLPERDDLMNKSE